MRIFIRENSSAREFMTALVDPKAIAFLTARELGLSLRYGARVDSLHAPFVELNPDAELGRYLTAAPRERHGHFKTWLHRFLRGFLSDFDINGLLGTYPMHVLSTAQFRELLSPPGGAGLPELARLLDIGAGRGDVTAQLGALFSSVTVTETSRPMRKRLEKAGYQVIAGDYAERPASSDRYDVVSLLNVLDRCDKPLSLLATARAALVPGGKLLVALVLPYRPFVYESGVARSPSERLPLSSDVFERAAREFIDLVLPPLGLTLETVSRAPYLSGGDAERPLYELDDLILVCRADFDVPLLV